MANAQMTLRSNNTVAHVQIGEMGDYEKYDFATTDAVVAYFNAHVDAGDYGRSFANTDTKYVPVIAKQGGWEIIGVPVPTPVVGGCKLN